jgi:hypothetical protein
MIVLGSHGWGALSGALLGSALAGVLRKAALPRPRLAATCDRGPRPDGLSRQLVAFGAASALIAMLAGCGRSRRPQGRCLLERRRRSRQDGVRLRAESAERRPRFDRLPGRRLLEHLRGDRGLASSRRGVTQGGSSRPGALEFIVSYSFAKRQIGQLEVSGPVVTTEGFPPVTNLIPLVLEA